MLGTANAGERSESHAATFHTSTASSQSAKLLAFVCHDAIHAFLGPCLFQVASCPRVDELLFLKIWWSLLLSGQLRAVLGFALRHMQNRDEVTRLSQTSPVRLLGEVVMEVRRRANVA
jgi:hypothetical protein